MVREFALSKSDSCFGTQPEDRRSSETIGGKRDAEDSVQPKVNSVEGADQKYD